GGDGVDVLTFNDRGATDGIAYELLADLFARAGAAGVTYGAMERLVLNACSATNLISLAYYTGTTPVTVNGGAARNAPYAPFYRPNTWRITGLNTGTLNDNIPLVGVQYWIGGPDADTYLFSDGAGLAAIRDYGGFDTLDYSAYTTAVVVDLPAFTATGLSLGL